MRKAYARSLGCKVNAYEARALLREAFAHGFIETDRPEEADLIILNTCAVTSLSARKSRQALRHLRRLSPKARILLMGCASEEDPSSFPDADLVLGTSGRKDALEALLSLKEGGKSSLPIVPYREKEYEEIGDGVPGGGARANLKIEDGCRNFCSYCLIASLRGRPRSRKPRNVLDEARRLLSSGTKELVLTGTHIGFYGHDLGEGEDLPSLIRSLLEILPEEGRIRLGSLEESEVGEEMLRLFHKERRLCPHLHLPLQSGSPSVLKRMGRKYGREEYLRSVRFLREARPDIALTTDLIVGFPEESEEEHLESMDFLREVGFARVHVFPYSRRPGTKAALLKDLPPSLKKRRTREALLLAEELEERHLQAMEGKEGTLLVEKVEGGKAYGHTEGYLALALPEEGLRPGDLKRVILRREWMVRSDDE